MANNQQAVRDVPISDSYTTFVFSFKAASEPTEAQQFADRWFPAAILVYYNNVHKNFNCYRQHLNGSYEMIGDNGIPNVYTAIGDVLTFVKGQAGHWGVHYDIDQIIPASYDLLANWRR